MKKVMQSLFFILILLFLSGCQTDDNDSSKSAKEKQVAQENELNEDIKTTSSSIQISQLELIPLPQTIDEILEYPRGELAGHVN